MTIEIEKYVNPLTDFGFKKIFGEEANIDLLMSFLNSILNLSIKELTFKKTEHLGRTELDRRVIFDLYCIDKDNNRFIIELQKVRQKYFKDRTVYYSTFPIQEQAIKGDEWDFKLSPVYCVGILDFIFDEDREKKEPKNKNAQIEETEEDRRKKKYFYEVELTEKETKKVFYDKLKYFYISLPKFKLKENELRNDKEKWVYFLRNLSNITDIPDSLKSEIFLSAFGIAEISKFTDEQFSDYQSSLIYYRDLNNSIKTSFEEGEIKGKIEGEVIGIRKEKINTIIKFFSKKLGEMPIDIEERIKNCSDIEKLDQIMDNIFDITSFEEVSNILE